MLQRVSDGTLNTFSELLLARLPAAYDNRSWGEIASWLHAAMTSNDYYFVASQNAIGLFQTVQKRLRKSVDIEEIFCLGREMPRDKAEVSEIYFAAYAWGKRLGAQTLDLDNCTDLKKEDFKELFASIGGKIGQELIPYVAIR